MYSGEHGVERREREEGARERGSTRPLRYTPPYSGLYMGDQGQGVIECPCKCARAPVLRNPQPSTLNTMQAGGLLNDEYVMGLDCEIYKVTRVHQLFLS